MDNSQLAYTENQKKSFVAENICKGAVRFLLIVSAAFGSVALTTLSSLFSNMSVPSAAYFLSGLLYITFFVSVLSAFTAQNLFLGEKHYSRALRGLDVNALRSKVRSSDSNKAIIDILKHSAWLPVVFGLLLYFWAPLQVIRSNLTCMAVHHTLADKPKYPLANKIKQLNCPDPTKPKEEP